MTGISLNIRPTGGFREPSLRSAAPVLGETAPHSSHGRYAAVPPPPPPGDGNNARDARAARRAAAQEQADQQQGGYWGDWN